MLEELGGAIVIDADEIARRVQSPGGTAYDDIVTEFGREILAPDGTIDRRKLAAIVFTDAARRERLNRIVHPRVRDEETRLLERHRERGLVVLEVPLLLENGMQHLADRVVVVTVDEAERRRRLFARSGMTPGEVERRLAAQMPQEEKVRMAHHVIDNSGTPEETRGQVLDLLAGLGIGADEGRRLAD
jgi:dephospho-CoA kinase